MKLCKIPIMVVIFCLSGTLSAEAKDWAGPGCIPKESLRSIVDEAFGGEPKVAGMSVGLYKPGCGTFLRTRGKRDVVRGKRMTPSTKMHIGSLTKLVTTTLTLTALEQGLFGPFGLDTPVSNFFTEEELTKLTTNCSDSFEIFAEDRETGALVPALGICPDFTKVTLRHLLNANDGLRHFEELDVNMNGVRDSDERPVGNWLRAVGIPTFDPLARQPRDAFDVLDILDIYRHETAIIGGNTPQDFPPSHGNTGYELLGIILERVTKQSYNTLVKRHITKPLRVDSMILLTAVPSTSLENSEQISRMYFDITGASNIPPLTEDTNGVYPVVDIRGRPAVDVYDLDSFAIMNGAGGAGGLVADMKSYLKFFGKLIAGGLLSPSMQTVFDKSFVETGIGSVAHGFGVFRIEDPESGGIVFERSGATLGSRCLAEHAATSNVTTVVCVNQEELLTDQIDGLVTSVTFSLLKAAMVMQ